jgi:transcription elongation GreA/GreB family factor
MYEAEAGIMSRAFTKEDDGSGAEVLPDLPHSDHPNYVTLGGLAALQARLHDTRAVLAGLRAGTGDIETRTPIAMAERDIRFLEERIRRAIPFDPRDQPPGIVAFGAEVEVIDEGGVPQTYRIVGEDEADPARGLITPFSPLGRALIGAAVGDVAVWERPVGAVELEVVTVRFG